MNVSSMRTPKSMQGRLERTETNMYFKWEETETNPIQFKWGSV